MEDFEGKTVIVTGASRGIGEQIALEFASAAARVVVNHSQSEAAALNVVELCHAAGGEAIACQADIADTQAVDRMLATTLDRFGTIDVLVNNAGLNIDKPFLELTEDDWDRVSDVNLKGPFLCSQAVGREMMRAQRGSIVNISAMTAVDARKNAANYCSTKAGLNMLTKCMALELAPYVNVNCLALGFIDSPLVREIFTAQQLADVVAGTPLARIGRYDEVVGMVRFLASGSASFLTGQTVIFDGGRVMR